MADALTKVRPGQPLRIPAAAYNAFVDAAKATRGVTQDTVRVAEREQTQSLTPIKNTSGATIPRFGVLGVDGPLFLPSDAPESFKRRVALTGSTPSEASHLGKFVIALEPIAPGAIGMACATGLCAVQVEFPDSDRERRFADIADGSSANLKASDRGAATILWREGSGAGVRWAIVRLGGLAEPRQFPVKLALASGEQGSALIQASWTYDIADAITDEALETGVDPTAAPHNWRRPATGPVAPATFGSAHFNKDGDLVLDWINETPGHMWAFPIILSQTGGQQGTASQPATWRYAVTDATSGLTLVTNTDPAAEPHEWRRPATGPVEPATFGYASLSSAGVLVIGWINEVAEVPAGAVFPVNLALAEQDGGTATMPARHQYNVTHALTGEPLGVFVDPVVAPHRYRRPNAGRMAAGSFGYAHFQPDGEGGETLVIGWVNEAPEQEACSASGGQE